MIAYIKKFWVTLLGGFVFGIALAILLGIPWRFTLSLAIFLFILNTIIEQSSSYSAVTNLAKKVFAFAVGVVIFVGLRAVAGYLLDLPASQTREDLVSGNGVWGIATRSITANIVFEILFLIPGMAIAYLVVREGRSWKTVLVLTSSMLLCWVGWTIRQKNHSQAMKRQAQASIALDARSRNNHALINEAAAATSFGIAKERVSVFYQWDASATNLVVDRVNRILQTGEQVLQLRSDEPPVVFEGMAFVQVVLANTSGSFVGGTKTWVEARQFNWVDGRGSVADSRSNVFSYTVSQDEVVNTLSFPDNTTIFIEADKPFAIFERGSDGTSSKLTIPLGVTKKYFAWGGTLRIVGLHANTTVKLHL